MKSKLVFAASLLFLPALAMTALAQTQGAPDLSPASSFFNQLRGVIGILVPVVFGLAIIFFFWGVAKFILAAGDEEKRKEGKKIMLWGVIAIFIIASIGGIVLLLGRLFGVSPGGLTSPQFGL